MRAMIIYLIIRTHSLNISSADDRSGTEYGLIKYVMLDILMACNNWRCQTNAATVNSISKENEIIILNYDSFSNYVICY